MYFIFIIILITIAFFLGTCVGRDSYKKKVKKLITMGIGRFPSANAEFNWLMDWDSARRVINFWPTPIIVNALGSQFLNGKKLSSETPKNNPVRRCYEIYMVGENRGNFNWDLIAAYHGVLEKNPFFEEIGGYSIVLEPELGINHWVDDDTNSKKHTYLKLKSSRVQAKRAIEELLIKPPKIENL